MGCVLVSCSPFFVVLSLAPAHAGSLPPAAYLFFWFFLLIINMSAFRRDVQLESNFFTIKFAHPLIVQFGSTKKLRLNKYPCLHRFLSTLPVEIASDLCILKGIRNWGTPCLSKNLIILNLIPSYRFSSYSWLYLETTMRTWLTIALRSTWGVRRYFNSINIPWWFNQHTLLIK